MSAKVTVPEHFKRLLDFSGREDAGSFWPYAALVFAIVQIIGMVLFVPVMVHAMGGFAGHAGQLVTDTAAESGRAGSGPFQPFPAGQIALYLVVSFGLAITLYAAAVARRLHDRGKSGAWGVMPLPFIVYSTIQMPRLFGGFISQGEPDMIIGISVFFSNFFYIGTLIWLIVMLAGPSEATSEE